MKPCAEWRGWPPCVGITRIRFKGSSFFQTQSSDLSAIRLPRTFTRNYGSKSRSQSVKVPEVRSQRSEGKLGSYLKIQDLRCETRKAKGETRKEKRGRYRRELGSYLKIQDLLRES